MEKNRGYLGDSCSALEREPERDTSISISICGVPYVCTRVSEKGVGVELAQPSRDHRGTFNAHPMYTVLVLDASSAILSSKFVGGGAKITRTSGKH